MVARALAVVACIVDIYEARVLRFRVRLEDERELVLNMKIGCGAIDYYCIVDSRQPHLASITA